VEEFGKAVSVKSPPRNKRTCGLEILACPKEGKKNEGSQKFSQA